eukprot:TRINITY_DN72205_c0_g1_i1.p1 TRINITY_DN72205_c0_g1~~TRINITY_DN72205_c0_g1_i1.p1  ORF type:complete len:344 (+),score=43.76 TRINITY_DN72205_c0_g1_i1:74-1033(+)
MLEFLLATVSLALFIPASVATVPRSEILNVVRESPTKAGAHDREGWLDLYTPHASLEDPKGTGAMIGREMIGRFYDAFIADNLVKFTQVFYPDIVSNASRCEPTDCQATVGRFVEITTTLSTGLVVKVSPVLIYEVVGTPHGLRINSLRTYWPLMDEFTQVLRKGFTAVPALMAMSASLLKNLGFEGTISYARGIWGVGNAGEDAMKKLVTSMNRRDMQEYLSALRNSECRVPFGTSVTCERAWALLIVNQYEIGQVHAAGNEVGAALRCSASNQAVVLRLKFGKNGIEQFDALWDDENGTPACGGQTRDMSLVHREIV